MSDVDLQFPPDIVARVQRYLAPGRRVFNPIVYYDCPAGAECVEQGWADGGPGIIAAYAGDIMRFGGYDVATYGQYHGFEDMDFFFRVRYAGLEIVRKREPRLLHLPHPPAPWRLLREQKFGKTWQAYWDVISQNCSNVHTLAAMSPIAADSPSA